MQNFLRRFIPGRLNWKGILVESSLFLAAYIAWLVFRSPASSSFGRAFLGNLAILAPLVTAALLIVWARPALAAPSRRSWFFLALALACWVAGNFVRTYYQAILDSALPAFSLADLFNFLAYPFMFLALIFYPAENRYQPSRFRFLLDALISSGAVATLGWLVMARPAAQVPSDTFWNTLPLVYPVADLVLLMILVNTLLANPRARRTSILWGASLLAFLASDYVYSYQALIQGYQAGGAGSLGWVIGGLLFGLSAAIGATYQGKPPSAEKHTPDAGARLQNILPIVLVLTLIWFVLADWRLRGELSRFGLWMALLLGLGLIVRLGVRAGEVELYRYWQLFSGLAEPTFICDSRGKILLANPALMQALDAKESQALDQPLTDFFGNQDGFGDLLARAARGPVSLEVQLRTSRAPYLLSLSPILTGDRKALIAGVAYDIREQKRQQQAIQDAYQELQAVSRRLEELNSQLEEKVVERTHTLSEAYRQLEEQNKMFQALDQLKSDFVSMVSHELRTPLTSLHGGLELLLARPGRRPEDQAAMMLMKNEVQRLTHFVENILHLSAMEAGRLVVHLEPVDLSLLMQDVSRTLNILPGADRIETCLPPDLPMVLADENFLHSILSQLLDNALKYAPAGPVTVDTVRNRNRLRVRVADCGPGIPREKRNLLFNRFQRLDARDSQSVYGFGLGLYMSRQLLRAHKSDLYYEKSPQGGARFYFDLKVIHES